MDAALSLQNLSDNLTETMLDGKSKPVVGREVEIMHIPEHLFLPEGSLKSLQSAAASENEEDNGYIPRFPKLSFKPRVSKFNDSFPLFESCFHEDRRRPPPPMFPEYAFAVDNPTHDDGLSPRTLTPPQDHLVQQSPDCQNASVDTTKASSYCTPPTKKILTNVVPKIWIPPMA